jgi:hypothetical protein
MRTNWYKRHGYIDTGDRRTFSSKRHSYFNRRTAWVYCARKKIGMPLLDEVVNLKRHQILFHYRIKQKLSFLVALLSMLYYKSINIIYNTISSNNLWIVFLNHHKVPDGRVLNCRATQKPLTNERRDEYQIAQWVRLLGSVRYFLEGL